MLWLQKRELDALSRSVEDSIKAGKVVEETGVNASRNRFQSVTLLDAIEEFKFDVAMGGGRRDEEKARAKERFFSHRDEFGQWDPKNQRPELWNIFNGRKNQGEHFRAFPISNWTEMDVWQYVLMENIEMPCLYFTHKREVFNRDGVWLAAAPFMKLKNGEKIETLDVRCRTIGDITCTGLTLSKADNLSDIIDEVAATRVTERGGRADDKRSEAAYGRSKKKKVIFRIKNMQNTGISKFAEMEALNRQLEKCTPEEVLKFFLTKYKGKIALASSMGAEDQVLTNMICEIDKSTRIFTLDTGRLFPETYELIDKTNQFFKIAIEVFFPDAKSVEQMTTTKGVNHFYQSIENRKECCRIRKIDPLRRAFANLDVLDLWITQRSIGNKKLL